VPFYVPERHFFRTRDWQVAVIHRLNYGLLLLAASQTIVVKRGAARFHFSFSSQMELSILTFAFLFVVHPSLVLNASVAKLSGPFSPIVLPLVTSRDSCIEIVFDHAGGR